MACSCACENMTVYHIQNLGIQSKRLLFCSTRRKLPKFCDVDAVRLQLRHDRRQTARSVKDGVGLV